MAKKKNQPTRTKLEEINDSLSGIEQKFEQHKNIIYWIVCAILVIAFGLWAYVKFGYGKEIENSNNEIAKADAIMVKPLIAQQQRQQVVLTSQDSTTALQIYESVAKKYGHNMLFKNGVGNRAKLQAAQILLGRDKTAEAQQYLEDYSPKGKVLGPVSQVLLGDIYVDQAVDFKDSQANVKDKDLLDKALKSYDKAIDLSKETFWEHIGWLDIVLFLLALGALAAIVYYARKKDDPKLRRLILIISAVVFLASAGFLAYRLISHESYENKSLMIQVMMKKATVLDAQGKYDEELKIYEEIEAKYAGPGSMTMQIERAKAKSGK